MNKWTILGKLSTLGLDSLVSSHAITKWAIRSIFEEVELFKASQFIGKKWVNKINAIWKVNSLRHWVNLLLPYHKKKKLYKNALLKASLLCLLSYHKPFVIGIHIYMAICKYVQPLRIGKFLSYDRIIKRFAGP